MTFRQMVSMNSIYHGSFYSVWSGLVWSCLVMDTVMSLSRLSKKMICVCVLHYLCMHILLIYYHKVQSPRELSQYYT
ncbi:hypothetical protein GGS20DRAFT_294529 [Poronia punctata]|nr:hypothetical protein GGS20DRAFT_294529 [Poronia punctata]